MGHDFNLNHFEMCDFNISQRVKNLNEIKKKTSIIEVKRRVSL